MNRSIILGAIIVSAAILVNGILERRAHVPSPVPSAASTSTALPDQTIAVLPFTSLDAGDSENSLAAGIQQQIITRLTAQNIKTASIQDPPRTGESLLGKCSARGHAGPRQRAAG